jgi:hypothetical protein
VKKEIDGWGDEGSWKREGERRRRGETQKAVLLGFTPEQPTSSASVKERLVLAIDSN